MTITVYTSGASSFATEVYVTDRNNVLRNDISKSVLGIGVDTDIDRSGSKLNVSVETHEDVLRDGQWIAPYQVIVPETGDSIRQQMGHFRLRTPLSEYRSDSMVHQSGSGGDIIDDIARVRLAETFYTPVGGNVMQDVRVAIKMATCGLIGPNLVTNGGFESGTTGWTTPVFELGATGQYEAVIPQRPAPEGTELYAVYMGNQNPVGARVYIRQTVTLPAEAQYLMTSAIAWRFADQDDLEIRLAFLNAVGATIKNSYLLWNDANPVTMQQFVRRMNVDEIPDGAVTAYIYAWVIRSKAANSSRSAFDDIQVRTCTAMPIPDSRIQLPPSTTTATTRIQTIAGKSYAYDAINARLSAIGHTAIVTTLDGSLTTRPSRDAQTDTAVRTYGEDDYRFVGTVKIVPSATGRYNHVLAIKEDTKNPANTLTANVYNDDRDDPWSIYGELGLVGETITVQDAVDEAALTVEALAVLARASMQEQLTIQVLPDPTLTVFDVIEITAGPERAIGRWSIESLEWGMSGSDPLVKIGARRNVTGRL